MKSYHVVYVLPDSSVARADIEATDESDARNKVAPMLALLCPVNTVAHVYEQRVNDEGEEEVMALGIQFLGDDVDVKN